jgi:hypothetical protein
MLKATHCLENRLTDGGEVVSLMRRKRYSPHKQVYLSLLEAAYAAGSSAAGRFR